MHDAAREYVTRKVREHRLNRASYRVVELGSFDVNGSVRPLFSDVDAYTGVDVRAGKGVDVVMDAAEYTSDAPADVIVTTEMLEHARNAAAIIANAHKLLAPGGYLVITAAGPGRTQHGNDGGNVGDEFYRNVTPDDLAGWLKAAGFLVRDTEIEENTRARDIYATARKKDASKSGGTP